MLPAKPAENHSLRKQMAASSAANTFASKIIQTATSTKFLNDDIY